MDTITYTRRMSGGLGCDIVSGTAEFTARRGRIYAIQSNESNSRILNWTEEVPVAGISPKTPVLVANRSFMSVKRIITITLTGTGGTATVVVGGVTKTATFSNTLTKTASDFVTANAAAYLNVGYVLTSLAAALIFTAVEAGTDAGESPSITNATDDLAGDVVATAANRAFNCEPGPLIIPDYPLTKFTPAKGSFWVYYDL